MNYAGTNEPIWNAVIWHAFVAWYINSFRFSTSLLRGGFCLLKTMPTRRAADGGRELDFYEAYEIGVALTE